MFYKSISLFSGSDTLFYRRFYEAVAGGVFKDYGLGPVYCEVGDGPPVSHPGRM